MINFRILGLVGSCVALAVLGVSTIRLAGRPAVWEEHILPAAAPSAARVSKGLQISVRGRYVEIRVPDCSASAYPDRFFVHVYRRQNVADADYLNMSFLLADETPVRRGREGDFICSYKKSFSPIKAGEVIVGQYAVNDDGTCCDILWSRAYFPAVQ